MCRSWRCPRPVARPGPRAARAARTCPRDRRARRRAPLRRGSGAVSTRPSACSRCRASRIGVRLMPSSCASSSSLRRWPGTTRPSTMAWRMSSAAAALAVRESGACPRETPTGRNPTVCNEQSRSAARASQHRLADATRRVPRCSARGRSGGVGTPRSLLQPQLLGLRAPRAGAAPTLAGGSPSSSSHSSSGVNCAGSRVSRTSSTSSGSMFANAAASMRGPSSSTSTSLTCSSSAASRSCSNSSASSASWRRRARTIASASTAPT